jgi:hypothetical protein
VLGKGAFKTVHKAYDSLEGCEVAWNTVQLVGVPEDEKKRIINEVTKAARFCHQGGVCLLTTPLCAFSLNI